MRIAQVAPLFESVPPISYGGTERVVSYLTEALVAEGHEVTLFATEDSVTRARLVACCPRALRSDKSCQDPLAHRVRQLELVFRLAPQFDLIHFHVDFLHFPLSRRQDTPHVSTLHGRLDIPDLIPLYRQFPDVPVVSISDFQRRPLPWLDWRGTVYHGLPLDLYRPGAGDGGYLAFLGRFSPEKRVDRAIQIAEQAGIPLKIAAKTDPQDNPYYEEVVRPLLKRPFVDYIGEIGEAEKEQFLGRARALLFPIDWPEPFGLAMIEALACGTPVIAFRQGSVPEILEEGQTGFVVDTLEEAIAAVPRIDSLSRSYCRESFADRFSVEAMTEGYLAVYRDVVASRRASSARAA